VTATALPEGFVYQPDFLDVEEELRLLACFAALEFEAVEMRDKVARRRVLHFGLHYQYESWRLTPGPPLPSCLEPLRERVAAWLDVAPSALAEVLLTRVSPEVADLVIDELLRLDAAADEAAYQAAAQRQEG